MRTPWDRILIVGVNWMGDMIFMTPAIRAIRRAFPESHIACLVPARGLDLLEGNPHLNEVIPFKESRGLGGLLSIRPLLKRLAAGRFDAVFLFHRSFSRTLAAWAAGIRCRIGTSTWKRGWLLTHPVAPPAKNSLHKAEGFLRLVEAVGIPREGSHYEAGLSPEDHRAARALLEGWGVGPADRLVALHPGANWRLKRWPAENFARLADALEARFRAKVLFVGGAEDLPLVQGIVNRMKTRPIVATGRTTFRQSGALLSLARMLISNDSGPLHLGIAVGTPVVALFGPTPPKLTGPPEGAPGMTLFGSVGCPVPCMELRCPANLCMGRITVEQVLEAANEILKGPGPFGGERCQVG